MALAARLWLSTANASWSARVMPHLFATFSAVTPMWIVSKGSVSAHAAHDDAFSLLVHVALREGDLRKRKQLSRDLQPSASAGTAYRIHATTGVTFPPKVRLERRRLVSTRNTFRLHDSPGIPRIK